jgi:hypothetical protein
VPEVAVTVVAKVIVPAAVLIGTSSCGWVVIIVALEGMTDVALPIGFVVVTVCAATAVTYCSNCGCTNCCYSSCGCISNGCSCRDCSGCC